MTLDLDKLEALVQAMTPGPWEVPACGDEGYPGFVRNATDAAGIVALVNAASELIRMARDANELELVRKKALEAGETLWQERQSATEKYRKMHERAQLAEVAAGKVFRAYEAACVERDAAIAEAVNVKRELDLLRSLLNGAAKAAIDELTAQARQ